MDQGFRFSSICSAGSKLGELGLETRVGGDVNGGGKVERHCCLLSPEMEILILDLQIPFCEKPNRKSRVRENKVGAV